MGTTFNIIVVILMTIIILVMVVKPSEISLKINLVKPTVELKLKSNSK